MSMSNADLIACIQAEERGETIEVRLCGSTDLWRPRVSKAWNTFNMEYRIAPKPRRCWVKWNGYGLPEAFKCTEGQDHNLWRRNGFQLVEEAR